MKKTAIVTGSSRGIGFAIAKKLGEEGYNLVLFARSNWTKYKDKLGELTEKGITWTYVQGSLDNTQDRERLVETAVQNYGRIDVLVNNAGVAPEERKDLLEMTEESYDQVMNINTKGPMFLTQLVARQMLKQEVIGPKRGTIIFVSSCSAVVSSTSRGEYCVSKAGVSMLTTLYADRLAKEGILVHEVRPGVIKTDMTHAVEEKYNRLIEEGLFPIARWGTPEDVANVVALFAGDEILYTTGNYIDVDGGFHIKRL